MVNCKNNPGDPTDRWESTINAGTPDGRFIIDRENEEGDCSGKHEVGNSARNVEGKCDGKMMWLLVPVEDPEFLYVGRYVGARRIEGFRFTLADLVNTNSKADLTKRKDNLLAAGGDEWVADKPPAFTPDASDRDPYS